MNIKASLPIWLTRAVFLVGVATCSVSSAAPDAAAVRAQADALIAQMTPEEKAGQFGQFFYIAQVPALAKIVSAKIEANNAGSVLFVTDPAVANQLQKLAIEKSRFKIPLLLGYDVIHGFHTIFPVPLGMAASWDPQLVEQVQGIAAREARAVGIHWAFAPMVDIARDPRWGRMVEGAGEDPYLGSVMAAAQVRGFQGPYIGSPDHIIAGPKHFAGYGAALGGRDYDEVDLSDSQLWNVYLKPFKAAVDAGAGNIMSAYMQLNGVPASGNAWLLTKVLRETWGFKGFVVSDAGAVRSLVTQHFAVDPQDAGLRALKAGMNLEMAPPGGTPAMASLPEALKAGKVTLAEIDDAVRPILEAKIRMGLFEHPFVDEARVAKIFADPEHRRMARVAAEHSAVLLRNEGGVLPLNRRKLKSLAVIGPLADSPRDTLGPWVFTPDPPSVSILAGLKAKLGDSVRIDYSEGVRMPPRFYPSPMSAFEKKQPKAPLDETAEIARAAELAKSADAAVLVLGEAQDMSGEVASRSSFELPGRQQELLDAVVATGKPVVLLLMSARPIELKGSLPGAILDVWYPGSEGGTAAANLLFGDAGPGGKLPFTWPRNASQVPKIYSYLLSQDPKGEVRRYWNESGDPTYPFGYGLSYTTFEYTNLHVERDAYAPGETVAVSVDLKNTGERAGDEVAQLYIHQRSGTSSRPIRELKGFQRVSLKSGKKRTLHFTLSPEDLRYWSAATGSWVQDEAKFDVWIGGSSTADLAAEFEVKRAMP